MRVKWEGCASTFPENRKDDGIISSLTPNLRNANIHKYLYRPLVNSQFTNAPPQATQTKLVWVQDRRTEMSLLAGIRFVKKGNQQRGEWGKVRAGGGKAIDGDTAVVDSSELQDDQDLPEEKKRKHKHRKKGKGDDDPDSGGAKVKISSKDRKKVIILVGVITFREDFICSYLGTVLAWCVCGGLRRKIKIHRAPSVLPKIIDCSRHGTSIYTTRSL